MSVNNTFIQFKHPKNINKKRNTDSYAKKISFGTNFANFPERVAISINKSCNLKCSYCPNSLTDLKNREYLMPMELFKKILGHLKEINFDGIFYFHRYNEPLATIKAESYIEEVNKNIPNANTTLYTNGTFLNAERLKNIQNAGGIKTIVVTEHTKENSFLDRLPGIDDELLTNIYVRRPNEINLVNRGGIFGNQAILWGNDPCILPKTNLVINEKGLVVFCPDDFNQTVILGDLNKQTPMEVVKSEKFREISDRLEKGDRSIFSICQKCDRDSKHHDSPRISAIEFKHKVFNK